MWRWLKRLFCRAQTQAVKAPPRVLISDLIREDYQSQEREDDEKQAHARLIQDRLDAQHAAMARTNAPALWDEDVPAHFPEMRPPLDHWQGVYDPRLHQ